MDMSKKTVYFLQAGNAYGYGYGAGEVGTVDQSDFADLQKRHVVRPASDEEVETLNAKLGLEPIPAAGPGKTGGKKVEAGAEGAEAEAEAARK